ncbi:hypothetical protein Mapa_000002 [Marchantia paleacea]|nr:hypothetical protein Mapa_000002 [Marchantia paleacea]
MEIELDVASGAGSMLEGDGLSQSPEIPFEVVDDEEMAAIESAFVHAQSLASAYQSIKSAQIVFGSSLAHGCQTLSSTSSLLLATSDLRRESFVHTVTSSLSAQEQQFRAGGFNHQIGSSQKSIDISRLSEGEESESQSGSQSTVTAAAGDFFAGVADADGTIFRSSDLSDTMLVGSQSPVPVTRVSESENNIDIEDTGASVCTKSDDRVNASSSMSLLLRHRSRRGLSVTDFTASEWCEKQVEFSMTRGKAEKTPAMKAGSERHLQLEVEVVTRVEIEIKTKEDAWATRLLNFISGSRQLLSEGLTRELPVLGLLSGTWIVGIIDEIRLVEKDGQEYPLLVDTKTRRRRIPPSEPQKRNARLQLMSYKYLWDTMVETGLPFESFFQHFNLSPHQKFCSDVRKYASSFYQDCEIKCLQDLLPQIANEIVNYPSSLDTLLLRYEWQADQSLLGEDEFDFEHDWFMDRWQWHLQFWKGRRQAYAVPEDETWKCRHCSFASVCKPVKSPPTAENMLTQSS